MCSSKFVPSFHLLLFPFAVLVSFFILVLFYLCVSFKLIFHFLWDHLAHCGLFEKGVLLMCTLEGVSSVANFVAACGGVPVGPRLPFSQCVLCCQRQSF